MSDTTILSTPIEDASNAQLFYFATAVLGLDLSKPINNAQLRAKIDEAAPGLQAIRAPGEAAVLDVATVEKAPAVLGGAPAPSSTAPKGVEGLHQRFDPKVTLKVLTSNDAIRSKEVQIAVNGDVIHFKRNEQVAIPYRHYLALVDAVEMVAIEMDEIDPQTSLPKKEWIEQHSYPHQVTSMPSDAAIAEWTSRMAAHELA